MQRIERYGVVVLLFMMVTFVAVAMWDGGQPPTQTKKKSQEVAAAAPAKRKQPQARPQKQKQPRGPMALAGDPRARSTVSPNAARATRETRQAQQRTPEARRSFPAPPRATTASALRDQPARTAQNNVRLDQPRWESEQGETPRSEERFRAELRAARGTRVANDTDARKTMPVAQTVSRPNPQATRRSEPAPRRSEPKPATRKPNPAAGVYVVQAGDTLSGIAQKALGSAKRWREISELNPKVDPSRLFVGAKLALPGGSASAPNVAAPKRSKPQASTSGRVYVVQTGDMLSTIAQRELGSARHWRAIADLNPKVDPDRLFVGAKLRLPENARSQGTSLMAQAAPQPQRQKRNRVR